MNILRAISIKQPFVELILQGKKKFEYRTVPTNIRERVYLYASSKERSEDLLWKKVKRERGSLPRGMIVGSVENSGLQGTQKGGLCIQAQGSETFDQAFETKESAKSCFLEAEILRQGGYLSF